MPDKRQEFLDLQARNPARINREDIIELAQQNHILYNCLKYWQSGEITYEQFLQFCVMLLIKENEIYHDALLEKQETRMPVFSVKLEDLPSELKEAVVKEVRGKYADAKTSADEFAGRKEK